MSNLLLLKNKKITYTLMKFTLAIFALLSASVSSMRLNAEAEVEVQSLANMDAMMLASLDADLMEEAEKMTPA